MTLELVREEMAKSKLRRFMRPQNDYEGLDARKCDCVLFYRPASKRLTSRWRGHAEMVDVERDAAALSYQGSTRKNPRSFVKSYFTPSDASRDKPIDPPPVATKRHPPDNSDPREISSDDVHATPSVSSDGGATVDPHADTTVLPPLADGSDALAELVDLPGRALREKYSKLGYRRGDKKKGTGPEDLGTNQESERQHESSRGFEISRGAQSFADFGGSG